MTYLFQFPSNGKVYSKWNNSPPGTRTAYPFQFPSNGKVYSKHFQKIEKSEKILVVEFQFPSNGKVYSKYSRHLIFSMDTYSFNSLQTGKCIASFCWNIALAVAQGFQFPSNGKVYSKRVMVTHTLIIHYVSIPFKRESV